MEHLIILSLEKNLKHQEDLFFVFWEILRKKGLFLRGFVIFWDLPLRDRRRGWKREGQGAPRGRGASCCVSHCQPILSGHLTCLTLSATPSPSRYDPSKFLPNYPFKYVLQNIHSFCILIALNFSIY